MLIGDLLIIRLCQFLVMILVFCWYCHCWLSTPNHVSKYFLSVIFSTI